MLLGSFRGYRSAWLSGDVIAGLMLAAIAIPEQLATAKLAGFPVEAGLIAFAAGTIAFALLGSNRYVSVGADSTIAPIFATSLGILGPLASDAYAGLAALLALCVGTLLVVLGLLRAGWVADLLSIPVTTGFLAGISAHIIVSQLPSLLRVTDPGGSLIGRLGGMLVELDRTNPYTLALGAGALAVTAVCARVNERIPGALVALIAASLAVATLQLRAHGVDVVGDVQFRAPSLHSPALSIDALRSIAPLAVVVAAVCALQTSLVVRSFPADPANIEDPAADFVAVGAGNILAAIAGAFPVDASPPRTAVAAGAGGRSQLSGLVAVAAIGTIVGFFSRFTEDVPQAALAGILVYIGARLFRLRDMRKIARYSAREIQLVIAGALLVIVLPIQTGMLFAIMLSLAHGVSLVMWPAATELFRVSNSTIWWPSTGEQPVVDVPGVVVFAPAAPVNFTNADFVRRRLLALIASRPAPVKLVVIEASGMTDVDYTGSQTLQTTIGELRDRGIDVAVARLIGAHAQRAAIRSGLIAKLGSNRVFLSVNEAVSALSAPDAPAAGQAPAAGPATAGGG